MNLDSIKALLIGTAIAFSGGLLRVLVSIQNKEKTTLGTLYHIGHCSYRRLYDELSDEQSRAS